MMKKRFECSQITLTTVFGFISFDNDVHPVQRPRVTQGRGLQSICQYVGKIRVNPNRVRLMREAFISVSDQETADRGKMLLEWNIHLKNGIRKE